MNEIQSVLSQGSWASTQPLTVGNRDLPTLRDPSPPSEQGIQRVDLLVASGGNHFMREIAELYRDGFRALGTSSRTVIDQLPEIESRNVLSLIVAPHEFFPLFVDRTARRRTWRKVARNAFMLNTEQPGSRWFDEAFAACRYGRGIFDMNVQGVQAFERTGLTATYAPIGYGPSLEAGPENAGAGAECDVVFLGHSSKKRDSFFARHASFFQKLNCHLIFVPVDQPRQRGTGSYVAGRQRNALLRSAKIMLNIHSADRDYFEWHRVMCAMANRCLVISESSSGYEPLVNGQHLVLDELDDLPEHCERFLRDSAARDKMTTAGYDFVRDELSIENTCQRILEQANASTIGRTRRWRKVCRHVRQQTTTLSRLVNSGIRTLRRNPVTRRAIHTVHKVTRRVRLRSQLRDSATRRARILSRIAVAQRDDAGTAPRYTIEENSYCAGCPSPSISVVVTLYNYAEYVGECLHSVAASRADRIPGGFDVLVVDDGSTDASARTVRQLMCDLPIPIRLIAKHENTGLADARNTGFAVSHAPYVFMLDADNYVFPHCLEKLLGAITSGDYAASYGILGAFDNKTREGVGLLSQYGWDVGRLVAGPYIDAMALFDRDKVKSVGGYSTELLRYGWFGWEDYDLWLKLAQAGCECKQHPEIIAAYRCHSTSMIHLTRCYRKNLSLYFHEKFSQLLLHNPASSTVFGAGRRVRTRPSSNTPVGSTHSTGNLCVCPSKDPR